MRTAHFYNRQTGLFVGQTFSAPDTSFERAVAINTPRGCSWIEGDIDPLAQRVEIKTGKVIEYLPPQPGPDHEWNGTRWQLNAAAAAREDRHRSATARIAQLEASQHRALREAALGDPDARKRLQDIDDEIAALRSDLMP